MELYKTYRPTKISQIAGQSSAVQTIQTFLKNNNVPHALLLSGPSGIGKTTLARIIASELGCNDLHEINCAIVEPIDTIRGIRDTVGLSPLNGPCRVWILDEVQALSKAGFAQQAMLKILEDTPQHAYFMLCTTDPQKIIPTIRNRCTPVVLNPIRHDDLIGMVLKIAVREQKPVPEEVAERIAEIADGSARQALVLLEKIIDFEDGEQLEAVQRSDVRSTAYEIAQSLFKGARWPTIAKMIENVGEEDESIRRLILGYATSILLKGGKNAGFAAAVIDAFRDNFFDCGRAGLAQACWTVCSRQKT